MVGAGRALKTESSSVVTKVHWGSFFTRPTEVSMEQPWLQMLGRGRE